MKNTIILFMMGFAGSLSAQITGTVTDAESNNPLPGAAVVWAGTTDGTVTDVSGKFSIEALEELPAKLVFSYVGFSPDTVEITSSNQKLSLSLSTSVEMQTVEVTEEREAFSMSAASKL